ncbi:MAG: hypothetical protein ACR2OY_05075 [Boseongicola sp.]
MALHRKLDALLALKPDVAVISECASPDVLAQRGANRLDESSALWVGTNQNKGLGVFAFNGFKLRRHKPFHPTLRYILPVHVGGRRNFQLMAVWAQNASGGITRKHQLGPLRRALVKYRDFLMAGPAVVGGDWNNNANWDRPGWRINHMPMVKRLEGMNLRSVYHELRNEEYGQESTPTIYWRDRKRDGPTYHIDYVFAPKTWLPLVSEFQIGSYDDWIGNGLSDHVPIIIEF